MPSVTGGAAAPVYITGAESATPVRLTSADDGVTLQVALSRSLLDTFGDLRVAQKTIVFNSSSSYDTEPLLWRSYTSGANNTAAHNANRRSVVLTLGGTNAGYVVRQSLEYIPYQPGRSQQVLMTGILGLPQANVTRRIGLFDSHNGLFFQVTSAGLAVVVRSSTSGVVVDTAVARADWNLDTAATLDTSKNQVYIIEFGWLGTAIARFGLYRDGQIIYVHQVFADNRNVASFTATATLPLRYELSSTAAASATMEQICTAINSEGGYFTQPGYRVAVCREALASVATELALVAIRPAATFNSIVNRSQIRLFGTDVICTNTPAIAKLYYYPPGSTDPTSGGSWVSAGTDSAVEANISATGFTVGTPRKIGSFFVNVSGTGANARGSIAPVIDFTYPLVLDAAGAGSPLTSNTGGNPAYLVLAVVTTGGACTAAGHIDWSEVR